MNVAVRQKILEGLEGSGFLMHYYYSPLEYPNNFTDDVTDDYNSGPGMRMVATREEYDRESRALEEIGLGLVLGAAVAGGTIGTGAAKVVNRLVRKKASGTSPSPSDGPDDHEPEDRDTEKPQSRLRSVIGNAKERAVDRIDRTAYQLGRKVGTAAVAAGAMSDRAKNFISKRLDGSPEYDTAVRTMSHPNFNDVRRRAYYLGRQGKREDMNPMLSAYIAGDLSADTLLAEQWGAPGSSGLPLNVPTGYRLNRYAGNHQQPVPLGVAGPGLMTVPHGGRPEVDALSAQQHTRALASSSSVQEDYPFDIWLGAAADCLSELLAHAEHYEIVDHTGALNAMLTTVTHARGMNHDRLSLPEAAGLVSSLRSSLATTKNPGMLRLGSREIDRLEHCLHSLQS